MVVLGNAMHGFLDKFGMIFSPGHRKILTEAFDDAWTRVGASGAPHALPEYAEAARTHLAKHIISMARRGTLDREQLVEGALLYLSSQKLSRKPPNLTLP
jgi:hypothetical protein